jgi:hypothetical protein
MSYMTVIRWEMDHDSVVLFPWAWPWRQSKSILFEQVMVCCSATKTIAAHCSFFGGESLLSVCRILPMIRRGYGLIV